MNIIAAQHIDGNLNRPAQNTARLTGLGKPTEKFIITQIGTGNIFINTASGSLYLVCLRRRVQLNNFNTFYNPITRIKWKGRRKEESKKNKKIKRKNANKEFSMSALFLENCTLWGKQELQHISSWSANQYNFILTDLVVAWKVTTSHLRWDIFIPL